MNSNTVFDNCPFCGDQPVLHPVEEKDERRYMAKRLECCVTMVASIGYGDYRKMTEHEIDVYLTAALRSRWNTRVREEET